MSKNLKTYVFFILDKSGSMEGIRSETVKHFNSEVDILKKSQTKNMENFVSLVTFNEEVDEVFFGENVSNIHNLDLDRYEPAGMTAMLDAVGYTIDKSKEIEGIDDKNASCLCVIISDGKENSSKNFTKKDVSEKIRNLQSTGRWTFAYIGANQDLEKVSEELGIPKGNTLKYESNSLGFATMSETQMKYMGSFFIARSYGTKATKGFYGSDSV